MELEGANNHIQLLSDITGDQPQKSGTPFKPSVSDSEKDLEQKKETSQLSEDISTQNSLGPLQNKTNQKPNFHPQPQGQEKPKAPKA